MKIIQSPLLNNHNELLHGFTTKDVGNLAFHVNDNTNNVLNNHKNLAKLLCYDQGSLIHMKQIHSNKVHIVTKNDNFSHPKECDALVTNEKKIPLMVMVADCSPILFYDPFTSVIAVAHAGRKGAFFNIVKNTLQCMHQNFGSKMQNIQVSIGPNIKQCCYEVGEEILSQAKELQLEYAVQQRQQKFYLSIDAIILDQLQTEGIEKNNIDLFDQCTACNEKVFNSYRREPLTGRFAGIIMLQ